MIVCTDCCLFSFLTCVHETIKPLGIRNMYLSSLRSELETFGLQRHVNVFTVI